MRVWKRNILLFVGIAVLLLSTLTVSAESDNTGDVWHYYVSEGTLGWEHSGEKPNIDITSVSHTITGSEATLTMTVAGSIEDSDKTFYYMMMISGEDSYTAWYADGEGGYLVGPYPGGLLVNPVPDSNTFTATFGINDPDATYIVHGYAFECKTAGEDSGEAWWDYAPNTYSPWYTGDGDDQNTTDDSTNTTSTNTSSQVYKPLGNLTYGNITKKDILQNNTIIVNIGINPKRNIYNVNLSIRDNGTNPPENITNELDANDLNVDLFNYSIENFTIYRYIDIEITSNDTYVVEEDLESATITFIVNNSWIKRYDYSNSTDIYLFKYHNNSWHNLTITVQNVTQNYTYYEAVLPGLSTFAVVGSKVIEKDKTFDTDKPGGIPWYYILGFIIAALVILIIVLFKSRYIYIAEKEE